MKVTLVPLQIVVAVAAMLTLGVTRVQYTNPAELPVPLLFVTFTLPLAPAATTAVMVVLFTTLNDVAAVPPKLTPVAPVKLLPVIVTVVPVLAVVGVKDAIVGEQDNATLAIVVDKYPSPAPFE